uniref:pyruvate kinase n=1 Tax=Ananas comosus var. bracteatus TaxID=296719 RepID=A0A6V7QHM8_ANACO|nr:unnamed protein product [Ananas comosus var. bracteatus]
MLKKPCRILMDLAGPKLRTGRVTKEASVMKITPKMNDYGEMISPSLIWICSSASTPLPPHLSMDAILCVEKELLKDIEVGDTLTLIDARGNKRSIKVRMMEHVNTANCGFVGECSRTAFVKLGTKLYLKKKNRKTSVGRVVKMPTSEPFIMLNTGDLLTIFRKSCLPTEGLATVKFDSAWITCSSDHIFNAVKVGEPIAFDDGKIWGKVQEKNANEITVSITRANPLGSRLGSGKSINIPESEVQFKGLTEKDFTDLDFVATHADMVGLSFLRDVNDLITVQHELERRKLSRLGVVLKIETREAFENLPHLLFQAMRFSNPLGVMIARGDLMVECGWSEMASIQEDIMELCRAANIPVIWATQVLESLIKFGFPTRAEITDMASGIRSSCIMLNKGEHIVEAVSALNSILSNCSTKKTKKMLLKLPQLKRFHRAHDEPEGFSSSKLGHFRVCGRDLDVWPRFYFPQSRRRFRATVRMMLDSGSSQPLEPRPVANVLREKDREDDGSYASGGWKSEDGKLSCGYSSFRGKRASMEDFFDVKYQKLMDKQSVFLGYLMVMEVHEQPSILRSIYSKTL